MIEVNEYVRINMDNRNCIGIGRVSRIVNETIYVNMNNKYNLPVSFQIDKIVKHNKQPIDLVEIGDIVNGHVVTNILDFKNGKKVEKMLYTEYVYPVLGKKNYIYATEVKTILTKEQYLANCYKVGGEDE